MLERLTLVRDFLCADIASWSEHKPVLLDFIKRGRLAKASIICVFTSALFPSPCVVSSSNASDLFVCQVAVDAVCQHTELAGVDEQGLAFAIRELAVFLVFGQKPQTSRNLRSVKKLRRQGDHAVHQISLNQVFADLALAGLVRTH